MEIDPFATILPYPGDGLSFEETLALITDWGFEDEALGPVGILTPKVQVTPRPPAPGPGPETCQSISEPTGASTVKTTAAKKKSKRRRPKDELDKLRRHVVQLTSRRDELRLEATRKKKLDSSRLESAAMLELLANLQRDLRTRAEDEKMELRKILRKQRRKALYLESALRSGPSTRAKVTQACDPFPGLEWRLNTLPATDDGVVFDNLARLLDGMYLETVSSLSANASSILPWKSSRSGSGAVFSDQDRKIFPFDQEVAEAALWESISERGIQDVDSFDITCTEGVNNTISSSWRSIYNRGSLTVDVLAHRVARKFIGDGHTIVVCRTLTQPTSTGSLSLSGFEYMENRYFVIQHVGTSGRTAISCYLEVERRDRSRMTEDRSHPRDAALLSNYERLAWQHLIATRGQTLENLLLDEDRKRRNVH